VKKLLAAVLGLGLGLFGLVGSASAQTRTNQRFVVLFSGTESAPGRVVATGPIRGVGTFEETDDENVVRFVFRNGSVTLAAPTENEDDEFNERTCSGSFTFSGPWEIIEATGAYEGASGSGTFEGRGRFFGERAPGGGCSEGEEGGFTLLRVDVRGNVTLGTQAAA
jgi:hypothetical protein